VTSKKLRKLTTTNRVRQFVDLSNEAPSDNILGEILLRKNWANGSLPARLCRGAPTIYGRLQNNKSNLTGLCIAGFTPGGRITEIIARLPNLTVLDISYSQFRLVEMIAERLPKKSNIKVINLGTTPGMKEGDGTDIDLHRTIKRFIDKCPKLTHIVLHGLGLPTDTIRYLRNLPETLRFLDLAMNGITDEEIEPLFRKCPNMESIDLSGTNTTTATLAKIAESWGDTIKDLKLPITMAKQLTLYDDYPSDDELWDLTCWISKMKELQHIQFGEYRQGMETEWHRSFNGKTSLGYVMEQRMIETLEKTLPSTVTIHMDPYEEDNDKYYQKHEVPKPNPKFPPKSSSSYVFQTLGRKDKTERGRNTYRNHYTNSGWLSPIRRGRQEYYLEHFESLKDEYGYAPEGIIKVPHTRTFNNDAVEIAEDDAVAEAWGWEDINNDKEYEILS